MVTMLFLCVHAAFLGQSQDNRENVVPLRDPFTQPDMTEYGDGRHAQGGKRNVDRGAFKLDELTLKGIVKLSSGYVALVEVGGDEAAHTYFMREVAVFHDGKLLKIEDDVVTIQQRQPNGETRLVKWKLSSSEKEPAGLPKD